MQVDTCLGGALALALNLLDFFLLKLFAFHFRVDCFDLVLQIVSIHYLVIIVFFFIIFFLCVMFDYFFLAGEDSAQRLQVDACLVLNEFDFF